ncbi:hypothetical protein F900_01218 [Acinetobacter modestus]|uniref:Uncharacterized protein n=1 Tax=Acinetobacter modestus TaxID=1776740 RepID=N9NL92_9GAMM|nr:hypothetical protein F900_01218 [Acinetobacter modestus]
MRILLAEDDASQAESIKDWLEIEPYRVCRRLFYLS